MPTRLVHLRSDFYSLKSTPGTIGPIIPKAAVLAPVIEASRRFRQELTPSGPGSADILREAREQRLRRTSP